ncbi:uncharacterized protein MYCFIDRAFT_183603 [Pseudocercospora fijiensis CIRAD86]|uniref:Uncharacterized protein n=1 Tax=Pseudocercospora fijiensis (strain CIRAD86) TaxID=383855 RepID=M3ANE6_PSEFD|nr:uncharacterized protein MYCFIDRAFT_183603 [Pseudocercospora fijiensis CIRAD86]EME78997.1 hypothetical protein MYCFIDRAFT_183603 [Pseudocercospora fijiensis CIRAD86]
MALDLVALRSSATLGSLGAATVVATAWAATAERIALETRHILDRAELPRSILNTNETTMNDDPASNVGMHLLTLLQAVALDSLCFDFAR